MKDCFQTEEEMVYREFMDLTDDESILAPLSFLRQREIVHYIRFKELLEYYQKKGYK